MFRGFSLNPEGFKRVSGSGKSGLGAGGRVGRKTGVDYVYELFFLEKCSRAKKNLPIQKIKFLPVQPILLPVQKTKKVPVQKKVGV